MAKMFYTLDETKAALGRNDEGIKQLSREGRLREFRDGQKLMFKADQVEALKAEMAGGGAEISLVPDEPAVAEGPGGTGAAPSLTDTRGSGLVDLAGTSGGTAAGSGAPAAQGTRAGGITIFDVDDSQKADPSAQTAISPARGGDPFQLESVGSGSGLLDLTKESDDTSLGAVFDELGPDKGGTGTRAPSSTLEPPPPPSGAVIDTRPRAAAPVYVEAPDPLGSALGIACVVPIICLGFAAYIIFGAMLGYRPDILNKLRYPDGQLILYAAGALVATVLVLVGGYFVANAGRK